MTGALLLTKNVNIMKKVKYQVQRRTNFNGCEELDVLGRFLTPIKALVQMEKLAFTDVNMAVSNYSEVTVSRTSDSRYPNAWGMANNGILISVPQYWWQWEVVEA